MLCQGNGTSFHMVQEGDFEIRLDGRVMDSPCWKRSLINVVEISVHDATLPFVPIGRRRLQLLSRLVQRRPHGRFLEHRNHQ